MVKALKLFFLPLLAIMTIVIACNKSSDVTVDDAVDSALYSIQERGGMGRFGCFELVFPVTVNLPDGTTAEVNSYDEMAQVFRAYYADSDHRGAGRPYPSFEFPVSVISQDGELITLNNADEMRRLRLECANDRFGQHDIRGHSDRLLSCFEIVFPINIEFPDGSIVQANSRQELHQLIRTWHQDHPVVDSRPKVVFPITVKLTEDGTLVTVDNREELHDLKDSCN